jgi:hypothetical protein
MELLFELIIVSQKYDPYRRSNYDHHLMDFVERCLFTGEVTKKSGKIPKDPSSLDDVLLRLD